LAPVQCLVVRTIRKQMDKQNALIVP